MTEQNIQGIREHMIINGKAVEFSTVDNGCGAVIAKDIIEEGAKIKVVLS